MTDLHDDGSTVYRFADLELNVGLQRVTRGGVEVPLPKLSFELLLALVEAAPNVVAQSKLLARVWPGLVVTDKTVSQRVKLLRDALGDDPEQPRYVVVLRGRGYRLKPPVERLVAQQGSDAKTAAAAPERFAPGKQGSFELAPRERAGTRVRVATSVLAILSAVVGVAVWVGRGSLPPEADNAVLAQAVAVLPFRDLTTRGDEEYLALGVAETVLDRLSTVDGLSVIARGSSFDDSLEGRSAQEIGVRLNARYVVDGSVQRTGAMLRVAARLVDAAANEQLWAQLFDRSADDIFAIEDEIAESVAATIRLQLTGIGAPSPSVPTASVEAYLAHLRGRAALGNWTAASADAAAAAFATAIELDPSFAPAYAARYDALMMAEDRRGGAATPRLARRALAAARAVNAPLIERALELDPLSGSAYFVRAIWSDADSGEREADFRRGLELDPSNGRGITAFAEFLDGTGRSEEAERVLARALEIDPLGARAHFWRVQRTFQLGSSADLESGMLRVLEIDPDYQPALQRYAKYRWYRGALAQAAQTLEHALSLDPESAWLAHTLVAVYLDLGEVAAARAVQGASPRPDLSGELLLHAHAGEIESAGAAAFQEAALAHGPSEAWGVVEALRDAAIEDGDWRRSLEYLGEQWPLTKGISVRNFRAVPVTAHLMDAAGDRAAARRLLADCLAWVDAYHLPRLGSIYALRVKATALQLLGETDLALAALDASFRAGDYVQWWYTLERDPVWQPLRGDPRFQAIAQRAREHVAGEVAALATMRQQGLVPNRVAP